MHEQFEQLQYALMKRSVKTSKIISIYLMIRFFRSCFKNSPATHSTIVRHAIRIAVVFAAGYGISLLPSTVTGFCSPVYLFARLCNEKPFKTQNNWNLTWLGIPILYFVPSIEGQLILFVELAFSTYARRNTPWQHNLNGIAHFQLKRRRFQYSRLIDTLLGCFIAWLAVNGQTGTSVIFQTILKKVANRLLQCDCWAIPAW